MVHWPTAWICVWLLAPVVLQQPVRPPDIFFVPTSEAVVDEMLQLAGIRADDVVYDLGSGDGRIIMLAAQKYGARGVGIEIDPKLVARAKAVAQQADMGDRVRFVEGDLFDADVGPATLVTLYLSPRVNERLEPKLKSELRPGTRIVSHQFAIGKWPPEKSMRATDGTMLYLWRIPEKGEGR
jgi:SAM-dependent methyltransferase